MMTEDSETQLRRALEEVLKERDLLRAENQKLRQRSEVEQNAKQPTSIVSVAKESPAPYVSTGSEDSPPLTAGEKVALYRTLFRGREDVYPIRWENKAGRSGYSPVCGNEWVPGICEKPRIKCSDCPNQKFLPVTDQVIHDHLTGKKTTGVYPLLQDETCWFLAADFDKENWLEDTRVFLQTCKENGIDAILERSRSGKGGHVWIFFETPIAAALARRLGSFLLTKAMEKRHQVGLDSYDRLFPSQDTMPKGGFGNLIALPLQREPRSRGNSVFINENGEMLKDPWTVFSEVRKTTESQIHDLLAPIVFHGEVGEITLVSDEEEKPIKPWEKAREKSRKIKGPFPEKVRITLANRVYIEKSGLPSAMINRILRLAAFQNPEFYRAQAMRLSTYEKPRIIFCGEDLSDHIAIPRGCLTEVVELLEEHEIKVEALDERYSGESITARFQGELTELQQKAASEMLKHDTGVLSATTAFGKTVVAAWIIAKRRVNTLVLVHRRQLMDQWKERLSTFLELPEKSIGEIGGGKSKATGMIDIATMQSLHREGEVKSIVGNYGQVIVDECHHVSAFSFEQVLKAAKAKYVLGLTATPMRKDGHHPIITMQCGPIRFKVTAKQQKQLTPFEHFVIPRYTSFKFPASSQQMSIQEIYSALIQDQRRNDFIFDDLLKALEAGRSPLVLTERTEHLEELDRRLRGCAKNVFVLRGGMGKNQRASLMAEISKLPDSKERVILATGRYIGEGFDDSRLDTLFLVIPISWKGTLQQYVGRIHRSHQGKDVVQVYDYVDQDVPMLRRMFLRRLRGYKAIGYTVQETPQETSRIPQMYSVMDQDLYQPSDGVF